MNTNEKLLAQKIIKLHQTLESNLGIIANVIHLESEFWEMHESHKTTLAHLAEVAGIPIIPLHYYESMRHFALNYACQSTDEFNQEHQTKIDSVKSWLKEINIVANS